MIKKNTPKESERTNYVSRVWYKFYPFWPLFAIFSVLFLIPALFLFLIIQPSYSITSAVVISDLNAQSNEDPNLRFINIYGSQKVVENEVRMLHSRSLMQEVVKDLALYAPVFEDGAFSNIPAYITSPVIIRARNPEKLRGTQTNISFEYNDAKESVLIEGKEYLLNEWYQFPFGEIRFEPNLNQTQIPENSLSFSVSTPLETTESLLNKLGVSSEGKLSSIINIEYSDVVPERGVDIVNQLLEVYNISGLSVQNQLAKNTLAFAEERIKELELELDSIERQVQQFRSEEGVIDLSEQGKVYLQSISENQRQAAQINVQLAVLEQVEDYLNSGSAEIGIVPTSLGIEDPVLTLLLEQLNQLELQYASLSTTTGANNPMVKSIQNEISKIRPNIRDIVQTQRSRLRAGLNNIRGTTGEFSSQLREIPEQERELLEISREQNTKREIYTYLLQRREEAAIAAAATISDIRVFEEPQASTSPSGSKRLLVFIVAVFLALLATIAFVLFREFLTNKVLFRRDLEKATPLPVVAEILQIKQKNDKGRSNFNSQQLFQLQLALGLFEDSALKKSILVTSALENEGKTFLIDQLAVSLASSGKKVLLVDFDGSANSLTANYNLQQEKGLISFLEGNGEISTAINSTGIKNLDIIPSGPKDSKPGVLTSNSLPVVVRQLKEIYDIILVDSSPVERSPDAYVLTKLTDATIFVVRHGRTPEFVLEKIQVTGELTTLKNAVIVFNGLKGRGFLTGYYGYNTGYGYESPGKI